MKFSGLPPQAPLLHSLDQQGKKSSKGSSPPTAVPLTGASHAESRRQEALQLVERTLAKGYEQLNAKAGKAGAFKAFEPLTAEKVANNILGFIERRLKLDAAEGATQEQLEARLEAGLAGFKKGFAEASEQLKALSMLSPEVEQDIGQTYDLVLQGIDALRDRFIEQIQKPVAPETPVAKPDAGVQAVEALFQGSYQYAIANSFSFEVMTAEGDKVTISASASQAHASQAQVQRGADGSQTGTFGASSAITSSLQWSVEGDLNDDELAALEQLLGQVNKLADSFFSGDLDGAFDQALTLGFDQTQISAFSLNLTQVEVQRVSAAYQQFADLPTEGLARESLLPLGNFIKDLLETVNTASSFAEPKALIADLSEKIVAEDPRESAKGHSPAERFRSFVEQVLSSLEQPGQ